MRVCDSGCADTRTYVCNRLPKRASCTWPESRLWRARARARAAWEERRGQRGQKRDDMAGHTRSRKTVGEETQVTAAESSGTEKRALTGGGRPA